MSEAIGTGTNGLLLSAPSKIVEIKEFYKNRDVFITGASGFMGKILLERLLWSCEDIGNVFVLLRNKKGATPQKRLEGILQLEVFDRIKKRNAGILRRIVPICGDITEINLGLSEEDRHILTSSVSVVFHVAANVKFVEPLSTLILCNVRGTRDVVKLARNMNKLVAFIHISTAYSNTHKQHIDERIYPPTADWRTFIKAAETNPLDLRVVQDKVMEFHPNQYAFSKHLAEQIVNEYRNEIPVVVLRPSVVIFCMKEPVQGWIEYFTGPIGMWVGYVTGVIHLFFSNTADKMDHIFCDYAVNGFILSACYRANVDNSDCIVLNAAYGKSNELTYKKLLDYADAVLFNVPPKNMMWYPSAFLIPNYYLYMVFSYILHVIPSFVFDLVLKIKGIDFSVAMIYRRIFYMHKQLAFFMRNNNIIRTEKYIELRRYMHPNDEELFPTTMENIDMIEAATVAIKGFKKYLLHEKLDENSLAKARKNIQRMYYISKICYALFFAAMAYVLFQVLTKYLTF